MADYTGFRMAELPRAERWVSRGPDQSALGRGCRACLGSRVILRKQEDNVATLAPGEMWSAAYKFGSLSADVAQTLNDRMDACFDRLGVEVVRRSARLKSDLSGAGINEPERTFPKWDLRAVEGLGVGWRPYCKQRRL